MQNDFKNSKNLKYGFTKKSGERFKKIFKMGLDNKEYDNFPGHDKIRNNFNKFIIEKYGVDIIGTCGEDNCDEHMIYIMNNIIVPALFNNTQNRCDDISYMMYDNDFFVKIPEYLECKGMECKLSSEAAEIRYKYKDLFISLSVEHNDNIIIEAEKRANDLFDQLDTSQKTNLIGTVNFLDKATNENTSQKANLIDAINCLDKATNEIENIINNKENTKLIRKSIKVLTDKDYLRLLKLYINTDIENMFKELYSLKQDLIKSDKELYSDYMFLLFFIEKIKYSKRK